MRRVAKICDNLKGAFALSATPGALRYTVKDTSSAGTPTYASDADGMKLTLASTNEAEVVTMYTSDILFLDIDDIMSITFHGVKLSASFLDDLVIGLGSAHNDTTDSMTANAWFKCTGSNSIVVESDDNVTDIDDIATGLSLGTTPRTLKIDFTTEIKTVNPGQSTGKIATFYVEDSNGLMRRVGTSKCFDMSGYSSGLQPFVQLQKASGTRTPSVTIAGISIEYREAFG